MATTGPDAVLDADGLRAEMAGGIVIGGSCVTEAALRKAVDAGLIDMNELVRQCRAALAGYKQPKQIRFVALDDLPRSTTGKIQRHEVENMFRRLKDWRRAATVILWL